ncbi:glycosyltransferase family A protein [Paraglaciecola aquimarina]|uniref:Glycosyltransferase family A protein n=1 Tax=Paraglaciecola aquimarina TaxID=1235557 RepID=A0ABU3T278_9ALTE|nr:glycosyltransferase family A protein [Paraglaciecola aquimarina]MDU0356373.1 glycosyltransferase family A protein [Paraglaciecola aquimarina]
MKKDLITVIIPVYNHENYVQHTINSIIQQTYSNIELIVINDGSRDKSNEMIKDIADKCTERFTHFTHIDKKNEGIIKTLNVGINMAQGKYLYIIASDDIAETTALQILHEFLSQNADYGLAVGGNKLIDSDNTQCYWDKDQNIVYDKSEATYLTFDEYLRKKRPNIDFLSEQFGLYNNLIADNHIPNGYLLEKKWWMNLVDTLRAPQWKTFT